MAQRPEPSSDCFWWGAISFDERDIAEITIRVSKRHAAQIATHCGESLTYQEAVRMLVAQGTRLLSEPDYEISEIPPQSLTNDSPNAIWWDRLTFSDSRTISKKVGFSRDAMVLLCRALPDARTPAEAVRTAINQALSERR